jgi:hypothetical protein
METPAEDGQGTKTSALCIRLEKFPKPTVRPHYFHLKQQQLIESSYMVLSEMFHQQQQVAGMMANHDDCFWVP